MNLPAIPVTAPDQVLIFALTVGSGTKLKVLEDSSIDVDWTQFSRNSTFRLICDRAEWLLKQTLCTEGQTVCSHPRLVPIANGMHLKAIYYIGMFAERNPAVEQKIAHARTMISEYTFGIYDDPRASNLARDFLDKHSSLPGEWRPFIKQAVEVVLSSHPTNIAPPPMTFGFDEMTIACHSPLKRPPPLVLTDESKMTLTGQVVGWTAQKRHLFLLKSQQSKKVIEILYDRDDVSSGWRHLRALLDESTHVSIEVCRMVADNRSIYRLKSSSIAPDLFSC